MRLPLLLSPGLPASWPPPLLYGAVAAAAAAVAAGTVAVLRHWRRESPEAIERARRLRLNAIGRMVAGEIVDLLPVAEAESEGASAAPPLAPSLVYQYEVGGVTYQASQALHLIEAPLDPSSWIPGWPVEVKFDPANPGNSIVACEHWSGLSPLRSRAARSGGGAGGSSALH